MTAYMEGGRKPGFAYSLALLAGVAGVVALGLLGLPVESAILLLFGASVVGVALYAATVIAVGHHQAAARRRRRRRAERAAAAGAAAPVPVPARLRSSA